MRAPLGLPFAMASQDFAHTPVAAGHVAVHDLNAAKPRRFAGSGRFSPDGPQIEEVYMTRPHSP